MNRTFRSLSAFLVPAFGVATAGYVIGSTGDEQVESLPLADETYVLGDPIAAYRSFMMSGGPPPDGIPSIDEPVFLEAHEVDLAPGDMVIGFVHEGEARAYPQSILVYHEIVNDQVGGLPVAITYCPLTATAQGFLRGDATLGVSGQLLNSNLVMYDRESGSYFSQIAATGLTGPLEGRTLQEVGLTWTTWERWQAVHPETRVLSDRTGFLRNYARDPYGSYNPVGGYYAEDATIFPLMHRSSEHHLKTMVVGARTAEYSVHFVLDELASARVMRSESFVATYDDDLHTGFVYVADSDSPEVEPLDDGSFRVGDETYAADELPLRQVVAVQAFFFAWHAFYPDSEVARPDA